MHLFETVSWKHTPAQEQPLTHDVAALAAEPAAGTVLPSSVWAPVKLS